jgi:aryl-alcohol dehydrogenase-like predicted oxidoreductase
MRELSHPGQGPNPPRPAPTARVLPVAGTSTGGEARDPVWPKGARDEPASPEKASLTQKQRPAGSSQLPCTSGGDHDGSMKTAPRRCRLRIAWLPMNGSGTGRPLGRSGISVPALGVGTNRWKCGTPDQARLGDTLAAALDMGTGFFDTAEIYNHGRSEIALGEAARQDRRPVLLASKFAPFPPRVTVTQFASALDKTLERLGRDSLDLYYLHFPSSLRGVGAWMRAMATAVRAGKIRAVGISNCDAARMRRAAGVLARYGIPLAANQVHYSLLHRKPETDGVLDACRRMDVALVAYRPIGRGAIGTGSPAGSGRSDLAAVVREVAAARSATATQVALAWLLKRDDHVIPIPGATRPEHVRENSGALSLELSDEEFATIDRASAPTPTR